MTHPANLGIRERNAARWQRHVLEYRSSSLTQREFCEHHGLALSTFARWCRLQTHATLDSLESGDSRPAGFVHLRLRDETPSSVSGSPSLSVVLPNGLRIQNIGIEDVPAVAALVGAL